MSLVQQAWYAIRQVDNVHVGQMYLEKNAKFVKMDSKIIPTAQVIQFVISYFISVFTVFTLRL